MEEEEGKTADAFSFSYFFFCHLLPLYRANCLFLANLLLRIHGRVCLPGRRHDLACVRRLDTDW